MHHDIAHMVASLERFHSLSCVYALYLDIHQGMWTSSSHSTLLDTYFQWDIARLINMNIHLKLSTRYNKIVLCAQNMLIVIYPIVNIKIVILCTLTSYRCRS